MISFVLGKNLVPTKWLILEKYGNLSHVVDLKSFSNLFEVLGYVVFMEITST